VGHHIFDNPFTLLVSAGILEAIILVSWLLARDRVTSWSLLAGPLLAGLVLFLDWAVDTNREQLERITRDVVQAVEDRHDDSIIDALDVNFQAGNSIDKTAAADVIKHYLAKPFIDNNLVRNLQVKRDDDMGGEVIFTVISFMDAKSPYYFIPTVTTQWQFDYARQNTKDSFKIIEMHHLKVGGEKPQVNIWKKNFKNRDPMF